MPPTTTTTSLSADQNNNKSLPISQEDKFYSRLLTKETSVANPSFRVYYGGASGAVPFLWESQPGTPKNPIYDRTLPPLTPPPSYFSNLKSNKTPKRFTGNSKPNLITTILPKLSLKKSQNQSHSSVYTTSSSNSSTSSSSSNSSSSSASVGPQSQSQSRRARLSSPRSSFSSRGDEYDSDDGSPTSTLCFCSASARHGPGGRARGGYKSVMGMKHALLSIVGHGSG